MRVGASVAMARAQVVVESKWRHVEISGGPFEREAFEPRSVIVKMEAGRCVDVFVFVAREEMLD